MLQQVECHATWQASEEEKQVLRPALISGNQAKCHPRGNFDREVVLLLLGPRRSVLSVVLMVSVETGLHHLVDLAQFTDLFILLA